MSAVNRVRDTLLATQTEYGPYCCTEDAVSEVHEEDCDVAAFEVLVRALNGFLWLDNNRDNYGSQVWLDYFDAAVKDARKALGQEIE